MSDGRLSRVDSFRARAWRDIHRREDVLALSSRAHRLLVGIVHGVLTPFNNAALTLGPATMARIGLLNKANAEAARAELVESGLLAVVTESRRGARTSYALSFLKYEVDPRNLPLEREVNLPPGREVTPQNFPPEREDFPPGREVL